MDTLEIIFRIFDIIGVIAFSISGSLVAINKKMDIFGVAILSLTTAIGGGVIRDVILGINPPYAFINPVDAIIALCFGIIVFIFHSKKLHINKKLSDNLMLIMDSIGLGVFTVIGVRTSVSMGYESNYFLQIFVGVLTGVGGGILRDIMALDTPYIFKKHFYACASLVGAICTAFLWKSLGMVVSMIIGFILVFVLRILAAHYHWSLPKAK